jgi:ABC-type uncharacterized transport system auxiliary subunit
MTFGSTRGILKTGLAMLLLCTGGCSGLTQSRQAAVRIWLLKPYVLAAASPARQPTAVGVTVTVIPGLDSDHIMTLSGDSELNHFAAGRWPDNLPELTASLISRTMMESGRFEVVTRRGSGVRADCNLHLLVEKFYAALGPSGNTSAVQVAMAGRYVCRGRRPDRFELSSDVAVNDPRMSGIVAAFQQAVDEVMGQLLQALQNHS